MLASLATVACLLPLTEVFAASVPRADTAPKFDIPEDEQRNWSPYSPWFPLDTYKAPPAGCQVNQVNIIQRHGARFPTGGATKRIKASLTKLQSVQEFTDPKYDFLKSFTYDLGESALVPFGAAQSFDAGQDAFSRYSNLVSADNLPFVRSDGSDRVIDTAGNWTAGFAIASRNAVQPRINLIIPQTGNDTLEDDMCPAAGDSDPQIDAWLATSFPNITAQLNAAAPGANLTDADAFNLVSLCPFLTVSKEVKSEFCTLFEGIPGAFEAFSYAGDLDKFYGTGYGQEFGPVQGVGYVNELLARLTNSAVQDNTQTNRTLDASAETFPLNKTFYADFSHDNLMVAVFSAMGLFKQSAPLSTTTPDPARTWRTSSIVPFSARMVVERLDCSGQAQVRVLVQDKVQPLEFCGGDANGLCTLDKFVESQSYARNNGNGDFEKCSATSA